MLNYIVYFRSDFGYSPTVRELQEILGIFSPNGVFEHLRKLAGKGWIALQARTARGIRILYYPLPLFRSDGGELVYAGDVCVEVNGEENYES